MELIGAKPERRIILYFLVTILLGSALLILPISTADKSISYIDALFTSTSATCVTGLIVVDTAKDYSFFGQLVILILIQLGGLGIMTFASALLVTMVPRLSFQDRFVLAQTLGGGERIKSKTLLKAVIISTLTIESLGALILFFKFQQEYPLGQAIFHSVFHSVAAFCNAGFSTFSANLEGYSNSLYVILTIASLVIFGGLGFVVISEIVSQFRFKNSRLSLHTKLALATTLALLIVGTAAIYFAERDNVLKDMSTGRGLANAFFQSVTPRTAGFNTIPQGRLTEVTILMTMILMFIGTCPGSTGGGTKTTTLSVLLLLAYSRIRGRRAVSAFKRSISDISIVHSLTVWLVAILIIATLFIFFMFSEEHSSSPIAGHGWFLDGLFEVVSAFGTVGLSIGITPYLHDFGKIILILLMFIGRVGLLTLVFSLTRPSKQGEIVYLEEEVMVG